MTRKTGLRISLAIAAVLMVSACGQPKPSTAPPETGDQAAATVGETTIWVSDVKREAVAQGLIGDGEPLEVTSELFSQVLQSVIDQKLLAAEARRRGLADDPAAKHRLEMAQDRILGDILVENSVQKAVTESAIQALYQETQGSSQPSEEVRARQIVTASQEDGEAVKRLIAAGATFESLVLTRSIDAGTRFSEGDLGYFTADMMPEEYAKALEGAKAAQIVGPFQVEEGWVLLKVEDRRPEAPITLEAARPQIVKFLTYDEVRDLLETLRKDAKVEVLIQEPQGAGAPEPATAPAAPGALRLAPEAAPKAAATPAPKAAPQPAPKAAPQAQPKAPAQP